MRREPRLDYVAALQIDHRRLEDALVDVDRRVLHLGCPIVAELPSSSPPGQSPMTSTLPDTIAARVRGKAPEGQLTFSALRPQACQSEEKESASAPTALDRRYASLEMGRREGAA